MDIMWIVYLVIGLIMAFAGRRFYKLFFALTGLVIGLRLPFLLPFLSGLPQVLLWIIGIALGVGLFYGANRALKIVAQIGAFLAGFLLANWVLGLLSLQGNFFINLIIEIVAGVVFWFLLRSNFDAVLIVLSGLLGGAIVADAVKSLFALPSWLFWVLLVIVAAAGIFVQWRYKPTEEVRL